MSRLREQYENEIKAAMVKKFGYKNVFVMAAVLTIMCSLVIVRMENAVLKKKELPETGGQEGKGAFRFTWREKIQVLCFAVFMIAPSCIVASYLSYFLPLYFENMGRGVSDVGRAQLLYGLIIVYIGPKLSKYLTAKDKKLIFSNLAYNLLFSAGLLLVGCFGGMEMAFVAVLCLAVADSFGFSVQNNYFLALPSVRQMGASKSLSYLSFLKKLTEMLGPTVFAMVIVLGYEAGLKLLGTVFLAAVVLFAGMQLWDKKCVKAGSVK